MYFLQVIELFNSCLEKGYTRMKVVPGDARFPDMNFIELAIVSRPKYIRLERDLRNFLQAAYDGIDDIHEKSKPIKYEGILNYDESKSGKRIIISGAPGCGKTTLSRKFCLDILSRKLGQSYDLVILFPLREASLWMKEEFKLCHLLQKFFPPNQPTEKAEIVSETIELRNGRGVMFILDGYDEASEEVKQSFFLKSLLSAPSAYLSECDVIVTSRPVTKLDLLTRLQGSCVHVEILGFKINKINAYIKDYFTDKAKLGDILKNRLLSLPAVRGMCCVPVVLKIVCKVQEYMGEDGLPRTMGGIYKKYICGQLYHSHLKIDPQATVSVTDLSNIPSDVFPAFDKLCEISYQFCIDLKLVISDADLNDSLRDSVFNGSIYELLFSESVDAFFAAPVKLYMFTHKTVQEALAALHIAKQSPTEQEKMWKEHFGRPEMVEVWKFYCGFTKLVCFDPLKLVKNMHQHSKKEKAALPQLLMISLFEAENEDLAKAVFTDDMFKDLTFSSSSAYETETLGYCLHLSSNTEILSFTAKRSPIQVELALPAILTSRNLKTLSLKSLGKSGEFYVCL